MESRMPPAELQRLFGIVESSAKPGSPIFHQNERSTAPKTTLADDGAEAQTRNWESLWIDMGGEG
jgi:hypothetical protein